MKSIDARTDLSASDVGELAWEVAKLFPPQGQWTETDFFRVHTNRMAELVGGRLEILPMPTWLHQLIVKLLVSRLESFARVSDGGVVLFSPLPTKLFPGTVREPDVLYVRPANIPADPMGYPEKLDLVMEVVSSGSDARRRDYHEKRVDYAQAGIAEYWIVDPGESLVSVLVLEGDQYHVLSESGAGQTAHSRLLPGFGIQVDDILALGKKSPPPTSQA